jgi:hypothetical protein
LRIVRLLGILALAVQFALFAVWCAITTHRGELGPDFSTYEQAAYLIGHGHLNPFATAELSYNFWKNDSEFMMWPIAVIVRVFPFTITLKLVQLAALVGAEAVAFLWICDIAAIRARRDATVAVPVTLGVLGGLMLVANPWYLSVQSFDFHMEPVAALFVLLTARDLYRGRRRAWGWAVLAALCGTGGASYIFALGVSMLFTGRCRWRNSLGLAVLGFVWLSVINAVGGNTGALDVAGIYESVLGPGVTHGSTPDLIKAAVAHPARITSPLWINRWNLWANLSPSGVFGLLWLPALLPSVFTLVEGALGFQTTVYGMPGAQNIVSEPLLAIGAIALLSLLFAGSLRRRRWLFPLIVAVLAVNVLAWAWVWDGPNLVSGRAGPALDTAINVGPRAATEMRSIQAQIAPADEVIVAGGIMGRFADRQWVWGMYGNVVPIEAKHVWFVVPPTLMIGVAPSTVWADMRLISQLKGVRVVAANRSGMWAFEWTPPQNTTSLDFTAAAVPTTPAWIAPGPSGRSVLTGRPVGWHAASTGVAGQVTAEPPVTVAAGRYKASVSLSVSSGDAEVQVFDASTVKTLWTHRVRPTRGRVTYTRTFEIANPPLATTAPAPTPDSTGSGIWKMSSDLYPVSSSAVPAQSPPVVEIVVSAPGGKPGAVRVYDSRLTAQP